MVRVGRFIDFTTKVECIFTFKGIKKIVLIKKFITELGVIPSIVDPVALYCDNNGVIV
jgi:hypothetical protein